MRLLLLHNPDAGGEEPSATALVQTLEKAGHKVLTRDPADPAWLESLTGEIEAVVAAGGDGTVRSTAVTLATQAQEPVPLAILPQGTANNIARSVGATGTVTDLASGLKKAERTRLVIGVARGAFGERHFVESAGVGFFASLLASRPPEEDRGTREDKMQAATERLRRHLAQASPLPLAVVADGKDLSGDYLLVEALNISAIGPGATLAPDADHAEPTLHLVLVTERERADLDGFLDRLAAGEPVATRLPSRAIHRLELDWPDGRGHVDDELWPLAGTRSSTPEHAEPERVTVEVVGEVQVLVA
jgi:diacylglycerol kinase (ATP)